MNPTSLRQFLSVRLQAKWLVKYAGWCARDLRVAQMRKNTIGSLGRGQRVNMAMGFTVLTADGN